MAIIHYQDGPKTAQANLEIPQTRCPDFDSCYLFAFVKSGSVLLNSLAGALMNEAGVPTVDLPGFCFENGIEASTAIFDCDQIFRPKGYCYAGFRMIPFNMTGTLNLLAGNKLLLVRDPRDMLVSLYYSIKFSHSVPRLATAQFQSVRNLLVNSAQGSIDNFCLLHAGVYLSGYRFYEEILADPCLRILRYEDFVFDKVGLAQAICDRFSLDIGLNRLKAIVEPFDVFPREDRPTEHIRQVHPGDHERKLLPATIDILNATLAPFLHRFDYSF